MALKIYISSRVGQVGQVGQVDLTVALGIPKDNAKKLRRIVREIL